MHGMENLYRVTCQTASLIFARRSVREMGKWSFVPISHLRAFKTNVLPSHWHVKVSDSIIAQVGA